LDVWVVWLLGDDEVVEEARKRRRKRMVSVIYLVKMVMVNLDWLATCCRELWGKEIYFMTFSNPTRQY
jgi:hypothetical protein